MEIIEEIIIEEMRTKDFLFCVEKLKELNNKKIKDLNNQQLAQMKSLTRKVLKYIDKTKDKMI